MDEYDNDRTIRSIHLVNWQNDGDVRAFVEGAISLKETLNADIEHQAEINTAWYRGHQGLFWNNERRRLVQPKNERGRVRLVVNLMQGLIDGYISKLGLGGIRLTATANSDDVLDYELARLQTMVLEHYHETLRLHKLKIGFDVAAVLHGEAYAKVIWDPYAGTGLPAIGPDDLGLSPEDFRRKFKLPAGENKIRNIRTGDLSVVQVPVFRLFWGPSGVPFEEAEWILELNERSVGHVMLRYGLKAEEAKLGRDQRVKITRPGESTPYGSQDEEQDPDIVTMKELWVRPNPALPGLEKGRHIVLANQKVVLNKANPYQHGELPYAQFPLLPVPSANRAETFTSALLPVQADLNRAVSQFCENRELMANPRWVIPRSALSDDDELVARPGGIFTYDGAVPPQLQQGAAMPNAVVAMIEWTRKQMQEIIGLRDVSTGKNPPGVRSGRGIAMLKEADDERMATINERRVEFWKRIGWLMLKTLEQYVREDRLIRIAGDESRYRIITFSGALLKGRKGLGASQYDIRVDTTGRPRSRSARMEDIDRAMQHGFLDPKDPKDKSYVMGILEDGDTTMRMDPKARARELQHERNALMAQGGFIEPAMYEDLDTMVGVLNEYRNRSFFRHLEPEVQKLFEDYEIQCIKLLALKELRLKTIAQEAITQAGGPPQPSPVERR